MQTPISHGFHLIEILIVLSLISLLSALTWPLYSTHIIHERRLEAQHSLLKLALAMEEFHIEHQSYQGATLSGLNFPEWIVKGNYRLLIQTAGQQEYSLIAEAQGNQAVKDRECGVLVLHSSGEKGTTLKNMKGNACWI